MMTKSELIGRLAARYPQLVAQDAEIAVSIILDAICEGLAQGRHIEIRGFGGFDLTYHLPRIGRNPRSGARVMVPAKYVPHFKPGKELRERVRGKPAATAGDALAPPVTGTGASSPPLHSADDFRHRD